jgi:hypothetical protein
MKNGINALEEEIEKYLVKKIVDHFPLNTRSTLTEHKRPKLSNNAFIFFSL